MIIQNQLPGIAEVLAKKIGNDCREALEKILRNTAGVNIVSVRIVECDESCDGDVSGLEIEFSDGEVYRTECCKEYNVEGKSVRVHRWAKQIEKRLDIE